MKAYKDRYRRIPIELIISPQYEGLRSDARFALLSLIISPRQTPAGIYDGSIKSLKYETALPTKRLKTALKELEECDLIIPVSSGGWWVKETFRDQCCNEDYAKAALNLIRKKFPEILLDFLKGNNLFLEKYPTISKAASPSDPRPRVDTPPTDPPQSPTGSESVLATGTDTGSGAGAAPKPAPATGSDPGSRGHQREGGVAEPRIAPYGGASASAPLSEKGNGTETASGKEELPEHASAILRLMNAEMRPSVEAIYNEVRGGNMKVESARSSLLKFNISFMQVDSLLSDFSQVAPQ